MVTTSGHDRPRRRLAAGLLLAALTLAAPRAFGEAPAAPHPAQIDRNGTLILIRSTILALQQANETGNYTVLRDLGAPGFQQANNPVRLGEIFANLRAQKLDLSGVTVLDPQLTVLPQIESSGLLHMAGFFPSVPTQINFELLYAPVNGRWRLFGISVNLGSSSPVAPPPPAVASSNKSPAGQKTAKVEPPKAHRKSHAVKPSESAAPKPADAPAAQ